MGIKGKNKKNEIVTYEAKVVIDALGVSTVLRRNLPENPFVDRSVDIDDGELENVLSKASDLRIYAIFEALFRNYDIARICSIGCFCYWIEYLGQIISKCNLRGDPGYWVAAGLGCKCR